MEGPSKRLLCRRCRTFPAHLSRPFHRSIHQDTLLSSTNTQDKGQLNEMARAIGEMQSADMGKLSLAEKIGSDLEIRI